MLKGPKGGLIRVRRGCAKKVHSNGGTCVYLVSVGKAYHEGRYLLAGLQFINEHFSKCIIVLADTLQRYNYELEYGEPLSEQMALRSGNSWLDRNRQIIQEILGVKSEIKRWDYWRDHPSYAYYRQFIEKLSIENSAIQHALERTAMQFVKKKGLKGCQQAVERSILYLKEECAIIFPLWMDEQIDYVVYPAEMTDALRSVYEYFSLSNNSPYARWLAIDFKRYALDRVHDTRVTIFADQLST